MNIKEKYQGLYELGRFWPSKFIFQYTTEGDFKMGTSSFRTIIPTFPDMGIISPYYRIYKNGVSRSNYIRAASLLAIGWRNIVEAEFSCHKMTNLHQECYKLRVIWTKGEEVCCVYFRRQLTMWECVVGKFASGSIQQRVHSGNTAINKPSHTLIRQTDSTATQSYGIYLQPL